MASWSWRSLPLCDKLPHFGLLTPYAAVKWSGAKLRTDRDLILIVENPADETWTINRMQNRKHWGWALGMTFSLCDMIGVTVEGRWGDESALHVKQPVRF